MPGSDRLEEVTLMQAGAVLGATISGREARDRGAIPRNLPDTNPRHLRKSLEQPCLPVYLAGREGEN